MNRRHLDHLPSRRIARAFRAALAWLRRGDNGLHAFLAWATAVGYLCWAVTPR
jgi:hypothetical protein